MDYSQEKQYLSELAKKVREIANLPIMAERAKRWYRHNRLEGDRPIVVIEMSSFENDLLPPPRCTSEMGRRVEKTLQRLIVNHEMVNDDKVVSPHFEVPLDIQIRTFGIDQKREYATDADGRQLGYRDEHFIEDLEEDFPKLRHSEFFFDRKATEDYEAFVTDMIGDTLPIVEINKNMEWHFGISSKIIDLMGMEAMMYALVDCPDTVKALYDFIVDDFIMTLDWMEQNDLLRPNNGNQFAGSGSYGFSDELNVTKPVRRHMLWGNTNSQETVSISPQMYHDFVAPAYERFSKEFGLLYYGCCEPVHDIWEDVKKYHNLRKVSISPWCNEDTMGGNLRGSGVIYSRKPSPNFLGIVKEFDEEAYRAHIDHTLRCAKGCELEIIHRDIYTLKGDPTKAKRAVDIIRQEIDKLW